MQPRAVITRESIINGAAVMFAAEGFGATSLEAIARAADVTKGALFFHFPTKAAIGQAVLTAPWAWIPETPRALKGPLERALELAVGLAREAGQDPLVRAGIRLAVEKPELTSAGESSLEHWRGVVGELLAEAGTRGELAAPVEAAEELVTSAVVGTILTAPSRHETRTRAQALATLLPQLLTTA